MCAFVRARVCVCACVCVRAMRVCIINGQICVYFAETSLDGTLRLVPIDDNPKRGRVELFNNGEWGTVCAYATNFAFAKVVCRQLGFPITLDLFKAGISNPGTGPILLSGVHCNGNEDYIQHCPHNGWDNVRCQHVDEAGVECASVFMCDCDPFSTSWCVCG